MQGAVRFPVGRVFLVLISISLFSAVSLASSYSYDLNSDNTINWSDLTLFGQQWLDSPCVSPGWCHGTDFDQSGSIDLYDFALLAQQWNNTLTPPANLVGWWQFDQGFGTIAYDSVASKDGTLTNMTPSSAWVAGYNSMPPSVSTVSMIP